MLIVLLLLSAVLWRSAVADAALKKLEFDQVATRHLLTAADHKYQLRDPIKL